nr:MAG TPA: hypothetical protein [Caudoviricetes sp.]
MSSNFSYIITCIILNIFTNRKLIKKICFTIS